MKQRFNYMTLAAAVVLTAACSQEDFNTTYLNDPDAVQISAQVGSGEVSGGFVTRSTPEGNTVEQGKFKAGDRISVSAGAQGPVVYKLDDKGNWAPEGDSFLKWEANSMNFTAYYPASTDTDTKKFTVPTDQSDANKIAAADYMIYPTNSITRGTSNGVNLQMQRKMARIVVKTNIQNQFDKYTVTAVTVHGNTAGYSGGTLKTEDIAVNAYRNTDGQFYALLSPTTVATGSDFIDVTVTKGGVSKTLHAKGIPATVAGKSYTVNLKVGRVVATVGSITIDDWQTGVTITDGEAEEKFPYVTFISKTATKFSMNIDEGFTFGEGEYFEYAVGDGESWTKITSSVFDIDFGGKNDNLRLRGKSSKGTAVLAGEGFKGAQIKFSGGGPIDCTGDIRTLIDYEDYATANTTDARFANLFFGCTTLATAPALPATTLASKCYFGMFRGCSALTTAPALPATTLAQECYRIMFYGCGALKTAPELPAETLAERCYSNMFDGCGALKTAPELPATTLASNCYSGMFNGCTTLTTAPALPATNLVEYCYSNMFGGCTALTMAPELPATTLAKSCYWNMFSGCTTLATAPELPATNLVEYCYSNMFDGCGALESAPELPATTLAEECYSNMFYGCTTLTTAPALPATNLAKGCYRFMFYGCTALTTAPAQLPATTLAEGCYGYMFSGCKALTTAPALPAETLVENCYMFMFLNCRKLSCVTMKATDVTANDCLYDWLDNAGGDAHSRTLTLANEEVYSDLVNKDYLPDNWKKDVDGGATIIDQSTGGN